ncbi:hypothetical protein NFI96_020726 [Prochilodus magdalenae]|nr:hypothetical protein NFI96_020726 [Prochilodus magdalenae]
MSALTARSSGISVSRNPGHSFDGKHIDAWITEPDPVKAAQLFTQSILEVNKNKDHLNFTLSLRDSLVERNRAIIFFYKRPKVQWSNPLQCRLTGKESNYFLNNTAIEFLTELSIVFDQLEGTKELSQDQKSMVLSVSLPWDLPSVTSENRRWLREKILLHAVLGRSTKQVKLIKRGLKDTGVLELFSSRPDTVPFLFPRASETENTSNDSGQNHLATGGRH